MVELAPRKQFGSKVTLPDTTEWADSKNEVPHHRLAPDMTHASRS
jgi:hypothetical protein